MSDGDPDLAGTGVYRQFGGVEMAREGDSVYPAFRFENNPGMDTPPAEDPSYPLGAVPASGDLAYALPGEPDRHPEMDFRTLANGLDDGRTVPNTTYLTHAIHKHPAIFIPHIPSYVVRQFTSPTTADGDRPLVLDPFSGSGTTGVEALVTGRDYLGVEINPLSRLVSEVATAPVPPSLLDAVADRARNALADTEDRRYEAYDVEFLDRTGKHHWFEDAAIRDLTRIRKVVDELALEDIPVDDLLDDRERRAVQAMPVDADDLRRRCYRWLVLTVANTVFEVSNADPGVSKAYRSQRMRDRIDEGSHPPDGTATFAEELADTRRRLTALWEDVAGEAATETDLDHRALAAEVDVRLADARSFDFPAYREAVDLAVTSPPYISAMNYYRGTKLRLFWIQDLLAADEAFDAEALRKSIVGTTSVSMSRVEADLPATLRSRWTGTDEAFEATRLPHLDDAIARIHATDYESAAKRAYVTWRFFAEDLLQALARTYEHLKPGAYFFFLIGENTICEQLVQSHTFVADIARNLDRFEGHGGDFAPETGYRLVGSFWDEISNRDLFQDRNHEGGVIECEWMVVLQKPREG